MKAKALILAAAACVALSASAQYEGYNRAGISYMNAYYGYNGYFGKNHKDNNFSLNGFGLDYIHGFSVTKKYPIYIETGASLNFGFGSQKDYANSKTQVFGNYDEYYVRQTHKTSVQNINLTVPVNVAYRIEAGDFTVTPFIGLNVKANLMMRGKAITEYKTNITPSMADALGLSMGKVEGEWKNYYSPDDPYLDNGMGSPTNTWNRFSIGWQLGIGVDWNNIYLGMQYGTDFIGAYTNNYVENGDKIHERVNCNTFKLSAGYYF